MLSWGLIKMASEVAGSPSFNMSGKQKERSKAPKDKRKQLDFRCKDVELRAREKGILKTLNEQFLREEYGADQTNAEDIDILNLPKRNIEMLGDISLMLLTQLKVCNFANNFLADISPLRVCTQLVKLDVSNNQISAIPSSSFWSGFTHLVVLYLHGNNLSRLSEVSSLQPCLQLQVLTLCDTPMSLHKAYRHTTVNTIPSLKALDCFVISDEEIIENFSLSDRFAPLSRPFGVNLYQPCTQSATCASELHQVACLLARVNAILAKHSPVIVIQRYTRGWLTRRKMHTQGATPSSKPLRMSHQRSRRLVSSAMTLTGFPSPAHEAVKERTDHRGPSAHATEQFSQPASKGPGDLAVGGHPVVGKHQIRGRSVVTKSPGIGSRADQQRLPRGTPDSGAVPAMCIFPSPSPPKGAAEGTGAAKSGAQQVQQHIRIPTQGAVAQQPGNSSSHNSPRVYYGSVESVSKAPHGHQTENGIQQHPQKLNSTAKKLAPIQGQRVLGHPLVDLCERGGAALAQGGQGFEEECEPTGGEEETEWRGELVGSAAQVQFYNPKVTMQLARKLDGHLVRKAEAEIVNIQAAQTVPRIPPSSHLLMKDDFDFRRVHDSMSLAALQAVEKAYRQMEKTERLRAQKEMVSRKQTLRKEIKEKIEEHHRRRLNEVAQWKRAHSDFVARAREYSFVEGDLRSSLHCRDVNCQRMLNMERRAEEGFVSEFSGINSSVTNSLKQEDNRLLREGQQAERTNSVQQLRRSNLIARATVLSQQQEKAEATRLRSAELRHELMKLKHKKVMDQYIAAKQKVEAVKHSLPPRTSRESRKVHASFARSKGAGPVSPATLGAIGDATCSVNPAPGDTVTTGPGSAGPKVVTISLEDYEIPTDSAVFLNHSLPPGRILRHYSFTEDANEDNAYEDPSAPGLGLGMFGIGRNGDAIVVGPSMTIQHCSSYSYS